MKLTAEITRALNRRTFKRSGPTGARKASGRAKSPRRPYDAVAGLLAQLWLAPEVVNWQMPEREYRFHPTRKWRFDLCWPEKRLAIECDGGLFIQGGHTRGAARERDYERDANALMLGWRVLRVSPRQVRSGQALKWLREIYKR